MPELLNLSPLTCAVLPWRRAGGDRFVTFVCSATYTLVAGESPLAVEQEPVVAVPFKQRPEVVLVGHAHAPDGRPARSIRTRLVVGEIDKSIEVFGERALWLDGTMREGRPIEKAPLGWERAAGGPDTANPPGMRFGVRDDTGVMKIPNLQPVTMGAAPPNPAGSLAFEPIGYGPLDASFPARASRAGRSGAPASWPEGVVPDDVELAFFNVAPRDQQLDVLHDDERIVLEGLLPDVARLTTRLPGLRPRAFVDRGGAAPEVLPLVCDTLWIDTDRSIATLTWRACVGGAPGRAVVLLEARDQQLTWRDAERLGARGAPAGGGGRSLVETVVHEGGESPGALPFVEKMGSKRPVPVPARRQGSRVPVPPAATESAPGTMEIPAAALASMVAPAWLDRGNAQAAASSTPDVAPPAIVYGAPELQARSASSWEARADVSPANGAAPVTPMGQSSWSPRELAAGESAVARASDAAAERSTTPRPAAAASTVPAPPSSPSRAAAPAAPPRTLVELLWVADDAARRARADRALRAAIAPPDDAFLDGPDVTSGDAASRDRRDVMRALRNARHADGSAVLAAFVDAADAELFEAPLLVVAGELVLAFDELETMRATASVVAAFAAADKRLREPLDAAHELSRSSWTCTPAAAEAMTTRLREAFAQLSRSVSPEYLPANAERVLLEGRHYRRRSALGGRRIRATLTMAAPPPAAGSPRVAPGFTTYLPEAIAERLPLFARMQAIVLAETCSAQEPDDVEPVSLVALAVARVVPLPPVRQQ